MLLVREVWAHNLEREFNRLAMQLTEYPIVSIDVEFPGCLRPTPRFASELDRYCDMKYNIDSTKMLQLGLTLSDEMGKIGGTWEFNFSNFDEAKDACDTRSIEFLKGNGLNFERMRADGIDLYEFTAGFIRIFSRQRNLKWVSFHGLYDFGYLLKLATRRFLPNSLLGFAHMMGKVFGKVFDLKIMTKDCKQLLSGELGLEKLGELLEVGRTGLAHHAGSDSLLTANCFARIKNKFHIKDQLYSGCLYGINIRIIRPRPTLHVFVPPCFNDYNSTLKFCRLPVYPPPPHPVYHI